MEWLGFAVLGVGILARTARRISSAKARRGILSERFAVNEAALAEKAVVEEAVVEEAVPEKGAGDRGLTDLLNDLQRTDQPLPRHRIYTQLLEAAYRNRNNLESRRVLLEQGDRYVKELEVMLPALQAEMGLEPKVLALKWLATALEEDKRYEDALVICRLAQDWKLSDGTKTGFSGRKRRIERKLPGTQHNAGKSNIHV